MTQTHITPELEQTTDHLVHIACCEDEDLALCGTDVSEDTWVGAEAETTCQLCDRLDRQYGECDGMQCPVSELRAMKNKKKEWWKWWKK